MYIISLNKKDASMDSYSVGIVLDDHLQFQSDYHASPLRIIHEDSGWEFMNSSLI